MLYALREKAFLRARSLVFRTPGLSSLVMGYRGRQMDGRYRRLVRHYAEMPWPGVSALALLARRSAKRLARLRAECDGLRILFVGTDYLQDSAGIIQALQRLGELVLFTQRDGRYGQASVHRRLSLTLTQANSQRLVELVSREAEVGKPIHLVIGQMWGGYIDGTALSILRDRFGCVVVNIAMDDRHTFRGIRSHGVPIGTHSLISHIDFAATTAPECVDWYMKEGCPALFLPEASDPELFHPMPELPKRFDVCFVGWRYGIRGRIVQALENAGVRVEAYGTGWPKGRLDTSSVPRLFAQSRIVLGVGTIGHSQTLYSLKMRDFDGPMSGTCYVTHDNKDLSLVYRVGEEIAVYRDPETCVHVVRALLQEEPRRQAIATSGLARARAEHTWDHRFRLLIDTLLEAGAHEGRGPNL